MKLKNFGFALLAACLIVFVSCREEGERQDAPPVENQENQNQNQNQNNGTNTTTDGTTASLNPAHGEPGHRCDIPVGQPLDQKASSGTAQQQQATTGSSSAVSPVRKNSATAASPTKNPPHGEPGHDCAVPVGADLDTK